MTNPDGLFISSVRPIPKSPLARFSSDSPRPPTPEPRAKSATPTTGGPRGGTHRSWASAVASGWVTPKTSPDRPPDENGRTTPKADGDDQHTPPKLKRSVTIGAESSSYIPKTISYTQPVTVPLSPAESEPSAVAHPSPKALEDDTHEGEETLEDRETEPTPPTTEEDMTLGTMPTYTFPGGPACYPQHRETPSISAALDARAMHLKKIFPHKGLPAACLFVASLSSNRPDDYLHMAVTRHFERFGPIMNVKVLKDWLQRPYAFVQFEASLPEVIYKGIPANLHEQEIEDARRALIEAHNTSLDGRNIRVEQARVNRTLFIAKFNKSLAEGVDVEKQLKEFLEKFGPVEDLTVLQNYQTGRSKGCGFVKYCYREDAIRAFLGIRANYKWVAEWYAGSDKLQPHIENYLRQSDSSEPGGDAVDTGRHDHMAANLDRGNVEVDRQSIFVGQLNQLQCTQQNVQERFEQYGPIDTLQFINKAGSRPAFAFIKYATEDGARRAVENENGRTWFDRQIRVQFRETGEFRLQRPPLQFDPNPNPMVGYTHHGGPFSVGNGSLMPILRGGMVGDNSMPSGQRAMRPLLTLPESYQITNPEPASPSLSEASATIMPANPMVQYSPNGMYAAAPHQYGVGTSGLSAPTGSPPRPIYQQAGGMVGQEYFPAAGAAPPVRMVMRGPHHPPEQVGLGMPMPGPSYAPNGLYMGPHYAAAMAQQQMAMAPPTPYTSGVRPVVNHGLWTPGTAGKNGGGGSSMGYGRTNSVSSMSPRSSGYAQQVPHAGIPPSSPTASITSQGHPPSHGGGMPYPTPMPLPSPLLQQPYQPTVLHHAWRPMAPPPQQMMPAYGGMHYTIPHGAFVPPPAEGYVVGEYDEEREGEYVEAEEGYYGEGEYQGEAEEGYYGEGEYQGEGVEGNGGEYQDGGGEGVGEYVQQG
ncbi:hypothetical protein HDV00_006311 [Rhizophlyctis rosea]|nr:hypothetical protein HDV00_006311 [Rhizophlyctis rosea]